jgi:hypothetical protein
MIKKIVKKGRPSDSSAKEDLTWWLSRPPEERLDAVEFLRRQLDGSTTRLQRTARVIRMKDLADLEALEGET